VLEYRGFLGESTAFGIGETMTLPTHALLQHSALFPELLDHIQLIAIDLTGEHQKKHLSSEVLDMVTAV
jgi:hypothetical protein